MMSNETTKTPPLVALVKDSPQWQALSALQKMGLTDFSFCLAGYCPPANAKDYLKDYPKVYAYWLALDDAKIDSRYDCDGILCGSQGHNLRGDIYFPMRAYYEYCKGRFIEYPLNPNRFDTVKNSARLPVQKNTANQITVDKVEDLPICDGVKLSDLLKLVNPETKLGYLPRLPILLKIATNLIGKTKGTNHYNAVIDTIDDELTKAGIGTRNSKDAELKIPVGYDKTGIKRILIREKITKDTKDKSETTTGTR